MGPNRQDLLETEGQVWRACGTDTEAHIVECFEHLVLSVCCLPSYCLLTPLMSPKDKKYKLIRRSINQLIDMQVKDAASQLEFLKEVGSAGVGSLQAPDLLYLQGLLAWKQGRDLAQVSPHTLGTPQAWQQQIVPHVIFATYCQTAELLDAAP